MNEITLNFITGLVIVFAIIGAITVGMSIKHSVDDYIWEHSDHSLRNYNGFLCDIKYHNYDNYTSASWGC